MLDAGLEKAYLTIIHQMTVVLRKKAKKRSYNEHEATELLPIYVVGVGFNRLVLGCWTHRSSRGATLRT